MNTAATTVELEDAGGRSWLGGLLAVLSGQNGTAYLRFVADAGPGRRYISPTFVAPRTFGVLPPRSEWAPDLQRCLDLLRRDLESDAWVEVGRGPHDWSLRYERPPDRDVPGDVMAAR